VPKAALIDYGVGNIFSMKNALQKAGFTVEVTSNRKAISSADAIVLPGVGAFGAVAKNIAGLKNVIVECVERGVPLLGSCLGMQLLFDGSEEGAGEGLGIINGGVISFRGELKIPHMGWNTIVTVRLNELMEGIEEDDYFYFVHSYYASPVDPNVVVAITGYGVNFPSVVSRDAVYGTQFHPEKSGKTGAVLLKNFSNIVGR
jgi:glutamine amidotransferase